MTSRAQSTPGLPPAGSVEAATTTAWLEGPSAATDGSVYFSDVQNNRLYRRDPAGQLTVYREPANYPNGTDLDAQGRLLVCEEGDAATGLPPRLTRTDLTTGRQEVVADSYENREFQGPNDVRVDASGRIFFTDGARAPFLPKRAVGPRGQNPAGVYRIDLDGSLHRLLAPPLIQQPNGLAIAPDLKTFYLLENSSQPGGRRQLVRFALAPDGTVTDRRVLHDFSPGRSGDSMRGLANGDLLVAAGLNRLRGTAETLAVAAGIYTFSPEGQVKSFVPVGEDSVTNIAQSPLDATLFFVTAGKTLFKLRLPVAPHPPKSSKQ